MAGLVHNSFQTNNTALHRIGFDSPNNLFDIRITPPTGVLEILKMAGYEDQARKVLDNPGYMEELNIRAAGFTPPESEVNTYEIKYKTGMIMQAKPSLTQSKTFELEFRSDSTYTAYHFFNAWLNIQGNVSTGYASNSVWREDDPTLEKVDAINYGVSPQILVGAIGRNIYSTDGSLFQAEGVTDKSILDCFDNLTPDNQFASKAPLAKKDVHLYTFLQCNITKVSEVSFTRDADGEAQTFTVSFNFVEYISPMMHKVLTGLGM